MSERAYPITEEEQLRRRILSPQPKRVPYSPHIDLSEPLSGAAPAPEKLPGCTFTKSCQLPDGIIHYADAAGYVPLELIKDYGHFSLLGGRELDSRGAVAPYTAERRGLADQNVGFTNNEERANGDENQIAVVRKTQ